MLNSDICRTQNFGLDSILIYHNFDRISKHLLELFLSLSMFIRVMVAKILALLHIMFVTRISSEYKSIAILANCRIQFFIFMQGHYVYQ